MIYVVTSSLMVLDSCFGADPGPSSASKIHRLESMDANLGTSVELQLLADPTRARILRLIMESPTGRRTVGELAAELELRQPTVSHHLKALSDAGFVKRTRDGRVAWYSMQQDQVDRVSEVLDGSSATVMAEGVLERISDDLAARFAGVFGPDTVERYVRESYALLAESARIRRYLPSFASRFATDRLSALARSESPHSSTSRRSCSSVYRTPVAPRWLPQSSATWPETRCGSAQRDPRRPTPCGRWS